MPTRQSILTNLATDLNNSFNINTTPKVYDVRVGVIDPGEFRSLPSIGVWITDDRAEEDLMDNTIFRRLNMLIYGHVGADMIKDYTSFYSLISSIEGFLYSTSNRVYKNVILGDVEIDYGGATEQTATFVLNFQVLYSQSGLTS